MARKIPAAMKPWLKFGPTCQRAAGIKPFKKQSAAQKRAVKACVTKKARAAGMSMGGAKGK